LKTSAEKDDPATALNKTAPLIEAEQILKRQVEVLKKLFDLLTAVVVAAHERTSGEGEMGRKERARKDLVSRKLSGEIAAAFTAISALSPRGGEHDRHEQAQEALARIEQVLNAVTSELTLAAAAGTLSADEAQRIIDEGGLAPRFGAEVLQVNQLIASSYWPIGLCVAWILTRDPEVAASRYVRHRAWTELRTNDGWLEAQNQLIEALRKGSIEALALEDHHGDGARKAIPPPNWIDLKITQRGPFDEICRLDGRHAYRDARIAAEQVCKLWPKLSKASRTVREGYVREEACRVQLIAMMQSSPNVPTPKAELRKKFVGLSTRRFDEIFTRAAADAKTPEWSRAGRRPRPKR
jgi:hypothetical protein